MTAARQLHPADVVPIGIKEIERDIWLPTMIASTSAAEALLFIGDKSPLKSPCHPPLSWHSTKGLTGGECNERNGEDRYQPGL